MSGILSLINRFVYRPDATYAAAGFSPADLGRPFEEVSLETADGVRLSAWYLPAARARHLLLYFHGNAGDIRDWVHAALPFLSLRTCVLMMDYRGYGSSEGEPDEQGLYLDGDAAWAWAKERSRQEGLNAAVLGKSLGSAVAIHIASSEAEQDTASLVLDSAFTSMREVVARQVPASAASVIPPLYESLERVPHIRWPTLMVHGERDILVPISQAEQIYEKLRCPKAKRVVGGAGHNDLTMYNDYHDWIADFLDDPLRFVRQKDDQEDAEN